MTSSNDNCPRPEHPGDISKAEAAAGILPSHGISIDLPIDVPQGSERRRPPIIQHLSSPAYQSPLRHHRRTPSYHKEVKETLNARSEYTNNKQDGKAEHHINQYIIKEEIGRGSFGAVHVAVDQYGTEYAVKEFSKARLRKRAQSNILRRPHPGPRRPGHLAAGLGFNSPLHRHSSSNVRDLDDSANPLYLIKEEIAIMKKLDHPNLVHLIEVLDDPEEDSLYMVMEMCKKGVVMKVGLNERADPYDLEQCRHWFRDLILGMEYLHAQGVVHRDIKPDNLLLTDDDCLKIVDFGVSEMFEKQSEMMTAKSAGSPAFLPPELCVTKHGDISGKAADIWSMGVTLYCLRFGHIPFERSGVLELYEAIKLEAPSIHSPHEPDFEDILRRLLEKDPSKRIKMEELREHPWVTRRNSDPLLPKNENVSELVEPPSKIEVNHAITEKMRNLIIMMRAVSKFKNLLDVKRPAALSDDLGDGIRTIHAASGIDHVINSEPSLHKSRSMDIHDRRVVETALATEGIHYHVPSPINKSGHAASQQKEPASTMLNTSKGGEKHEAAHGGELIRSDTHREKGHAHNLLDEEPLFLGIGTGTLLPEQPKSPDHDLLGPPADNIVAESPTAAEFSIYDTAYQEEVERIRSAQGHDATVYLTRRVEKKEEYQKDENMISLPSSSQVEGQPHAGWRTLVDQARNKTDVPDAAAVIASSNNGRSLGDLATKAVENTKNFGKEMKSGKSGSSGLDGLVQKAMKLTAGGAKAEKE